MLIANREGFAAARRRPPPSTPLYLETDGACFFDTGILLRTPLKIVCVYYRPSRGTGSAVWGAYRQSTIHIALTNANSSIYRQVGLLYNGSTITASTNSVSPLFPYRGVATVEADAGAQSLVMDYGASDTASVSSGLGATLTAKCHLFANGRPGTTAPMNVATAGTRIYSWQCWMSGTLVADVWPSMGEDGVTPSFYDRVGGRYLYNIGTGAPMAGFS